MCIWMCHTNQHRNGPQHLSFVFSVYAMRSDYPGSWRTVPWIEATFMTC
jgi:hypothetical protein